MTDESGRQADLAADNYSPLVSVAIITFNQKDFLRECLDSIVSQDYENVEIIVADDCSTDGTQVFLDEYRQRCPRALVLRLADKNRGITPNSNAAHAACSGKYIAWMGGDDLMLPGKIKSQVAIMESNPAISLCYHDLDVFESETGNTLELFSARNIPRSGTLEDVIAFGAFNGACSTMVRRSDAANDGFDVRLPIASDWKYWMDTLRRGGEVYYVDEVLGRYRRHGGNVTGSARNVPLANFQDHLAAVAYLMSEHPALTGQLLRRQADLLRSLRNYDGGQSYMSYMRASLRSKITAKSFLGLLAGMFGKRY